MRTPTIAGIVAALVLFPGCTAATVTTPEVSAPAKSTPAASATADSSNQSLLEACDVLGTTMDKGAKTLDAAMKTMGSDPSKSVTALSSFATSMETTVAKLGNPDVKAQGEKAVTALKGVITALDQVVKHPAKASMKTLQGPLAKMKTEFTAIGTVCGG
jgi:hypothetical protein